VAYFAALLARSADRWTARDADLDEVEDVAGLVELMREVPEDYDEEEEPDTAVLLLEQEDVWFAVIRLDTDEDPRLFVSDMAAVSRSAYADLLLSADLLPIDAEGRLAAQLAPGPPDTVGELDSADVAAGDDAEEGAPRGSADLTDVDEDGREHRPLRSGPAGDADLLADFGVRSATLKTFCREGVVPADALAELAAALGAAEELEEVR
jgi:putative tRNA adenosine deaminase-associated protein